MHASPLLPPLVGVTAAVLLLGALLARARQPQLLAYIAAGVIVGPAGLDLLGDPRLVEEAGALGVTMLLFFVGLELSPRAFATGWRVAVVGTAAQVALSVACALALGWYLGWPWTRSMLLGFVISLSSTAVVVKLLADRGELDSDAGRNVLLVLIAQDLAVIPMLLAIGLMGAERPEPQMLLRQGLGALLLLTAGAWLARRSQVRLPGLAAVRRDHELQVFAGLFACFGMALVSSLFGLSAPLGAFVGGMLVATARETHWVRRALEPFHVVFLAVFFVAVGMLLDVGFMLAHLGQVLALSLAALVTNTAINALILRGLGTPWRPALYAASLLAQVGEFSFVLAAVGRQAGIIGDYAYQLTAAIIVVTLVASAPWTSLARRLTRYPAPNAPRDP